MANQIGTELDIDARTVQHIDLLAHNFYKDTRTHASRVYVGQEDFANLRLKGAATLSYSRLENRDVYFARGLRIYVVHELRHLHVC